jgi:hypothetical protein
MYTVRSDGTRGAKDVCAGIDLLAGGYATPEKATEQRTQVLARLAREEPGAWFYLYCSEYFGNGIASLRVVRLDQRRFLEIQQREKERAVRPHPCADLPWPPPLAWDEMESYRRRTKSGD